MQERLALVADALLRPSGWSGTRSRYTTGAVAVWRSGSGSDLGHPRSTRTNFYRQRLGARSVRVFNSEHRRLGVCAGQSAASAKSRSSRTAMCTNSICVFAPVRASALCRWKRAVWMVTPSTSAKLLRSCWAASAAVNRAAPFVRRNHCSSIALVSPSFSSGSCTITIAPRGSRRSHSVCNDDDEGMSAQWSARLFYAGQYAGRTTDHGVRG